MKTLVKFLNESLNSGKKTLSKSQVVDYLEKEVSRLYGKKSGKVSSEEMDDICANYDNKPVGSLAGILTFDFGTGYDCYGGKQASTSVDIESEGDLEYFLQRVYSGSEKYFLDIVNINENVVIQCFSGYIKVINNGMFNNPKKFEYSKISLSELKSVNTLADCVKPIFDKTGVNPRYYKLLEDTNTYVFVGKRD